VFTGTLPATPRALPLADLVTATGA
jgi:hypothetical protein